MTQFNRGLTVLIAAFVLMSAVGMAFTGGAAAAVTAEGDLVGDDTDLVENFDATVTDNETIVYDTTANSDSLADFESLNVSVEYGDEDARTIVTYDADDADVTGDADDTSPLTLTWTVEHEDLDTLPGDAGEITTVDMTVTELEDAEEATAVTESFAVDYEFSTAYASIYADEPTDESEVELSTWASIASTVNVFSDDDDTDMTQSLEHTVGIAGAETDVHVHDATDNGTDIFGDRTENLESGDLVPQATAAGNDEPMFVFYEERDDDLVDDNDTYAVYDGGSGWALNLGDDYEDETELDVLVDSEDFITAGFATDDLGFASDLSFSEVRNLGLGFWDSFGVSGFDLTTIPFYNGSLVIPGTLFAGFAVTRRRSTA